MVDKDTSKLKIHSATTYKLYIFSCLIASSGLVLMLKFPEMHSLEPGVDPLSFTVYGLSIFYLKLLKLIVSKPYNSNIFKLLVTPKSCDIRFLSIPQLQIY